MNNNQDIRLEDIKDRNVYHNGKNYIYCGPLSNKGYILTKDCTKQYVFYANRLMISVYAGLLAIFITRNALISIAVTLVTYTAFLILFKIRLLDDLPVCENFVKPKREGFITGFAKESTPIRLLATFVLSLAIAGLLLYNTKLANYEGWLLYINYALIIGIAVYGLIGLVSLIIKIKNR